MSTPVEYLLGLQEHCEQLSVLLSDLWMHDPVTYSKFGEILEFNDAAEWLDVAASVQKVEVLTGGEDVYYCETVMDYENARSVLLSRVATQLTIFQFTWGAFETVAKIIGPSPVPGKGGDGLINQIISFIKSVQPFAAYDEALTEMGCLLKRCPEYGKHLRQGTLPRYMGRSGVGIDFVRKVRNKFAHGSARLGMPDSGSEGWSGNKSRDPELIALCCRIVLFTIQMLLGVYYARKNFEVKGLRDEDGIRFDADVHRVLNELHCKAEASSS
jgi:hypothetical protein